jgi:hypothetical protein
MTRLSSVAMRERDYNKKLLSYPTCKWLDDDVEQLHEAAGEQASLPPITSPTGRHRFKSQCSLILNY